MFMFVFCKEETEYDVLISDWNSDVCSSDLDCTAWYLALEAIGYNWIVSIESFTPDNQVLSAAVCVWKPLAPSQDQFARHGLAFLKQWAAGISSGITTD